MGKLIRAQFKEEDTAKVNEEKDFSDKVDGILDLIEKETGFRPDMNDLVRAYCSVNNYDPGPEQLIDDLAKSLNCQNITFITCSSKETGLILEALYGLGVDLGNVGLDSNGKIIVTYDLHQDALIGIHKYYLEYGDESLYQSDWLKKERHYNLSKEEQEQADLTTCMYMDIKALCMGVLDGELSAEVVDDNLTMICNN